MQLQVIPRADAGDELFHVAITSDEDSGGWVYEELERNLRICITEKTAQIQPFRHRYAEWWLVFVDHVARGLDEYDQARFKSTVHIEHSWDRIVLVSPSDFRNYFEL